MSNQSAPIDKPLTQRQWIAFEILSMLISTGGTKQTKVRAAFEYADLLLGEVKQDESV